MIFKKPLLAASLLSPDIEHTDEEILGAMQKLRYPVLVTEKMDGIRANKLESNLFSRTRKLIPNKSIRERAMKLPAGFDMELWNSSLTYDQVESIVMSKQHSESDKIQFHILDWFCHCSYVERCHRIQAAIPATWLDVSFTPPQICYTAQELLALFLQLESTGAEGICLRTSTSPYKCGRSTLREQYLVKLCRFHTSEAIIIGFKEAFVNANPEKRNAIGSMDRSSYGYNLIGKNTLGALQVRDLNSGIEFDIGTGFDSALRCRIWHFKEEWIGKVITYKYKGGGKVKPRSPVYKGLRKAEDIT